MTKNFTEEVLNKIKENKIKPRARWEFLLKDYLVWALGVLSLFIGALAFSVIVFMIRNNDWDLFQYADKSLGAFILVTLPYFWLASLGLFLTVAYYYYKHTKKGYRYRMSFVVSTVLILSICLGTLFYSLGLGQALDQIFSKRMPFYEHVMETQRGFWLSPEEGRLIGIIVAVEKPDGLALEDLNNKEWDVDTKAVVKRGSVEIQIGNQIKILGKQIGNSEFKAELIAPFFRHTKPLWRPWGCRGEAEPRGKQFFNNQCLDCH